MTPDAPLSEPVKWAVFEAREVGARTVLNAQAPGVEMVELADYRALASRVKELESLFNHYHVNAHDGTDSCKQCHLDLRDAIHRRVDDARPQPIIFR